LLGNTDELEASEKEPETQAISVSEKVPLQSSLLGQRWENDPEPAPPPPPLKTPRKAPLLARVLRALANVLDGANK